MFWWNSNWKIESLSKQHCDYGLAAILGKLAISTSMLEIEPTLIVLYQYVRQQ